MKCEEVRETFVESSLPAEAQAHIQSCASCAEAWAEQQKLFALLDEWEAPEVSPFFDTRLKALVREAKAEEARQTSGVFGWLRKPLFGIPVWRPAAAGALALAVAAGIGVVQNQSNGKPPVVAVKGTAVDDLQRLDKHQDEISNLELLDDLDAADMGVDAGDEL
jgi:anti-sigma-K factor RskA